MSVNLDNKNLTIGGPKLGGAASSQTGTVGGGEKFSAALEAGSPPVGIQGLTSASATMVVNSAMQGMAQQRSQQGTAFGAGAGVLPGGGDVTGSVGGSVGGAGGSVGGGNSAIGAAAGGGGGQDQLLNATKQMQETQMSFNLQYLQLQSQMQSENRSYTAVSNIMKTKHDTVKNSISNIR